MFRMFHVKKDERALLFKKGDFVDVLRPGEYLRFDPLFRLAVQKFALGAPRSVVHRDALAFFVDSVERQVALGELLHLALDLRAIVGARLRRGTVFFGLRTRLRFIELALAVFELLVGQILHGVGIRRRRRALQELGLHIARRRLIIS